MLTKPGQGIHPDLLAEPESTPTRPMQLKILKTRDVIDQRQRRTLTAGEITDVVDPVVAETLLSIGAAVRPGEPDPEPEVKETAAETPESTAPERQAKTEGEPEDETHDAEAGTDGAGDTSDASGFTWEDIPGISDASRAILMDTAPDADPATATPDQVEEWLGSKQRAVYVKRALDDYFEREG